MNKNQFYQGTLFTGASAVIFGFTPILTKISYEGGANGITMSFLRCLIALPVLLVILKLKGESLKVEAGARLPLFLCGIFGGFATTAALYGSYSYIPVSMATTLHFTYPVLVNIGCVLLFKEKMNWKKMMSLLCGMAGILLFMDQFFVGDGSRIGISLALVSGLFYSIYVIAMDKPKVKRMYYFKVSFYVCLWGAIFSGIYGGSTGQLALNLTGEAWMFAVLVAILTSVGAVSLFQLGVRYAGASNAAMLSTLEPIISVLFGLLILGERLTEKRAAGCILILASVVLIAFAGKSLRKTMKIKFD